MAQRHALHRLAATQEVTGNVSAQHLIDALGGQLLNVRLPEQNAGIVDQRTERAQPGVQRGEHRHHLRFIGHVGLQRQRLAALRLDFRHHLPRRAFVTQVIHANRITLPGQQQRGRTANPPARAGHQCHFRHTVFFPDRQCQNNVLCTGNLFAPQSIGVGGALKSERRNNGLPPELNRAMRQTDSRLGAAGRQDRRAAARHRRPRRSRHRFYYRFAGKLPATD